MSKELGNIHWTIHITVYCSQVSLKRNWKRNYKVCFIWEKFVKNRIATVLICLLHKNIITADPTSHCRVNKLMSGPHWTILQEFAVLSLARGTKSFRYWLASSLVKASEKETFYEAAGGVSGDSRDARINQNSRSRVTRQLHPTQVFTTTAFLCLFWMCRRCVVSASRRLKGCSFDRNQMDIVP